MVVVASISTGTTTHMTAHENRVWPFWAVVRAVVGLLVSSHAGGDVVGANENRWWRWLAENRLKNRAKPCVKQGEDSAVYRGREFGHDFKGFIGSTKIKQELGFVVYIARFQQAQIKQFGHILVA